MIFKSISFLIDALHLSPNIHAPLLYNSRDHHEQSHASSNYRFDFSCGYYVWGLIEPNFYAWLLRVDFGCWCHCVIGN